MFLFFALALSFISGVFNKNANGVNLDVIYGEVAASGVLIVTMLFSVMSTVAILVADALKKTKNGYSVKKHSYRMRLHVRAERKKHAYCKNVRNSKRNVHNRFL